MVVGSVLERKSALGIRVVLVILEVSLPALFNRTALHEARFYHVNDKASDFGPALGGIRARNGLFGIKRLDWLECFFSRHWLVGAGTRGQ